MTVAAVADYRWLIGPEAVEVLRDAAEETNPLTLLTNLRKRHSAERAALVAEQARLRRRALAKFPLAPEMFFTAQGLEQATDAVAADYKAARFPAGGNFVDLCCGIGGDLLALGGRGTAVGYDRDEPTAILAEANCRVVAARDPQHFHASAVAATAAAAQVADADAWHIDPDRRPQGRRTTHVELHEPSAEFVETLLAANPHAAIKLAPAAEPPPPWRDRAEWEWLSVAGECKQLSAWFGNLSPHHGLRRATILSGDHPPRTLLGTAGDDAAPHELPAVVATFGRYIFEPDAAVLAAHLTHVLAGAHSLSPIHSGSAYLTGDRPLHDAAMSTFEILDAISFDVRKVRAWLAQRHIGRLEIKKRGVDIDIERLRRELKLSGDAEGSLILARRGDRVTALLTRRILPPTY